MWCGLLCAPRSLRLSCPVDPLGRTDPAGAPDGCGSVARTGIQEMGPFVSDADALRGTLPEGRQRGVLSPGAHLSPSGKKSGGDAEKRRERESTLESASDPGRFVS